MTASTAVIAATLAAVGLLALMSAWIDAREHRLPNALVLPCYPVVALGMALLGWLGNPMWRAALLGALAWALPIGLLWLLGGRSGMGPGDAKLAVPLGASLGMLAVGTVLLGVALAFAVGGLAALVRLVRDRRGVRVPFGPCMVVGWCAALLAHVAAQMGLASIVSE